MLSRESRGNRAIFEVESQQNRSVRGDLARAIVEGGWDLNELRPSAVSLEEIFLQLTRDAGATEGEKTSAEVTA